MIQVLKFMKYISHLCHTSNSFLPLGKSVLWSEPEFAFSFVALISLSWVHVYSASKLIQFLTITLFSHVIDYKPCINYKENGTRWRAMVKSLMQNFQIEDQIRCQTRSMARRMIGDHNLWAGKLRFKRAVVIIYSATLRASLPFKESHGYRIMQALAEKKGAPKCSSEGNMNRVRKSSYT